MKKEIEIDWFEDYLDEISNDIDIWFFWDCETYFEYEYAYDHIPYQNYRCVLLDD